MSDQLLKEPWTYLEIETIWSDINPDVQLLLVHIAKRPKGCSMDALRNWFPYPATKIRAQIAELNRIHKKHRNKPRLVHVAKNGNSIYLDKSLLHFIQSANLQDWYLQE
jgi:hypothetical protein